MKISELLVLSVLALNLMICSVTAIPLANFYPFGGEVGDERFPAGKEFSPLIPLPEFNLMGKIFDNICVATMGHLADVCSYNYSESIDIYYADFSTPRSKNGGHIWYRKTSDQNLLERARTDIKNAFPLVPVMDFLFIATWENVTSRTSDPPSTFQGVIAVGGNQTYSIYLYADGLLNAKMEGLGGYFFQNFTEFEFIEGYDLTLETNIECPGVWVYRLDQKELVKPKNEQCDDLMTMGEPPVCSSNFSYPSYACTRSHGSCVPYTPLYTDTLCGGIYESGVDYVFVYSNRTTIEDLSQLLARLNFYIPIVIEQLTNCREVVRQLLCHYYLPPCGRGKDFTPPSAVCSDQCRAITQECPEDWTKVLDVFAKNNESLTFDGLDLINCDFPGEQLFPLPHCCTELNMNFNFNKTDDLQPVGNQDSGQIQDITPVIIGSTVSLIVVGGAVVTTVLIGVALLMRHHRKSLTLRLKVPEAVHDVPDNHYSIDRRLAERGRETDVPLSKVTLCELKEQLHKDNLLVPQESITTLNVIGEGEFGIVYKAILSDWKGSMDEIVAVKTVKGLYNTLDLNSLIEECRIMKRFDHPNVMKLLGVLVDKSSPFIIMPYMAHGSLLSYVRRERGNLMVTSEEMTDLIKKNGSSLLSMCLQIAKGMEYLWEKKFVHRDLAARNCMIDLNNVIKVADFGLTENLYVRNYFRQTAGRGEGEGEAPVKLPVKWMALESLNDGIFTEKTDVWSFGVTCWEVFSLGKNPYPGVDPFSLTSYLERGERLGRPLNAACSQEIYDMMRECWYEEPQRRPSFYQLVTDISTSLEKMAEYFELVQTPVHC